MYLKLFCIVLLLHYTRSDVLDLTCSNIRAFVDGHNSRRIQIIKGQIYSQPPASDMKYMIWDKELADKAAKWASRYTTQQDPDTSIESGRFIIHENTYKVHNKNHYSKLNIDDVIGKWFDQYINYNFGPHSYSENDNGNYIKMIKSKSKYIGCAISHKADDMDNFKTYYIICNYGPSDDYKNGEPYQAGPKDDKLLCDSDECYHPYGSSC